MKKILIGFIILTLATTTIGCNKEVGKGKNGDKVKIEEIEKYMFPLNGKMTASESNQRAIAVMINNHNQARPQSGISQADVIYEVLAEGDITRWLAVFQSSIPERIGPVRSARDYFISLALGFNAFYICHGNSPEAKEIMDKGLIDSLNGLQYDGTLFKRDKTRYAPHNSYITKDGIFDGAKKKEIRLEDVVAPLAFIKDAPVYDESWKDHNNLLIRYSSQSNYQVKYDYDSTKEGYVRSQGGVNTVDADNSQELLVKNLFIVKTNHQISDSKGRRDIDLSSGGEGYLLQNGKMKEVNWISDDGRILPVENGKVIPFIPGQTWINIVPNTNEAVQFDI